MLRFDHFEPAGPIPILLPDEIHVWFCAFAAYEMQAAPRRRAQELLWSVLQAYLGIPLSARDFKIGEFGRPALIAWPHMGFNLSHSHQAAIVAIAHNLAPGIDIEQQGRGCQVQALAQRYFCPTEAAVLANLPPPLAQHAFLALWTAKEAVLKAIGRGLAFGLHRLEFSLDENGIPVQLTMIAPEAGDPAFWQCCALHPGAGYLGCLAWQGPPRQVRTFRVSSPIPSMASLR